MIVMEVWFFRHLRGVQRSIRALVTPCALFDDMMSILKAVAAVVMMCPVPSCHAIDACNFLEVIS